MLPPDTPGYLLPIVEALLSGQTDEAACRSLGISPRTFSRRVAELLGHLNVTTRFQGGAELVLRGCRGCLCRNEVRPRP
jgi:DNA-binding NarL/FixJ family response regulator